MIHREDVIHAVRQLHWIFWAVLLVILDFSISVTAGGRVLEVDILNDTLGILLIAMAIGRLRDICVDSFYASRMRFVHRVAILALLESALQYFDFPRSWPLVFLSRALGIATIMSSLFFCASMRDLCRAATLSGAARAWSRTYALCLVLYAIPGTLLIFLVLGAVTTGQPLEFQYTLPPAMAWLPALLLLPFVSFFFAVFALSRAAASMPVFTEEVAPLPHATVLRDY